MTNRFDHIIADAQVLFIATLWTIMAIMTNQSYIGLTGLAILYRRYTKKEKTE